MVYVRGHAMDLILGEQGADGLGLCRCACPTSNVMESWHDGGNGGDPEWRGTDGPRMSAVARVKTRLFEGLCRGGQQAGL